MMRSYGTKRNPPRLRRIKPAPELGHNITRALDYLVKACLLSFSDVFAK